jgi:hypothetical protein
MLAQEGEHLGVEFLVARDAIEAGPVGAELGQGGGLPGRAGGEEGEMGRVRHQPVVGGGQPILQGRDRLRDHAGAAALRTPELDRDGHGPQILRPEEESHGVGDDRHLEARIVRAPQGRNAAGAQPLANSA